MNTNKIAYLLAFVLLFGVAFYAKAAEDNRYMVKSTAGVWKKYFGARHAFEGGFTADMSGFQLRLAKIFGLEVEEVHRLYVLPAEEIKKGPPADKGPGKDKGSGDRVFPSDQVPWGIEMIYNNPFLVNSSGGAGVNVAVLDTGILDSHFDLSNSLTDCKDFTARKSPVVDGKCGDKNGHGTHVAGIIATDGGNDGLGIYGVAPEASIYAYKVCSNSGSCWADDIAFAIRMAVDNGANIVNLSLGSDSQSPLI
ncbi:MAG: S8 family serine peptidase, partial [Anaerolineales bacterium]|nr:S8 family serine peptidase [Anaerolineales bacterium]